MTSITESLHCLMRKNLKNWKKKQLRYSLPTGERGLGIKLRG